MFNKINKTRVRMFVYALRSGNYKQTTGRLRKKSCFCAAGVACDVYSKETGNEWVGNGLHGSMIIYPIEVTRWYGRDGEIMLNHVLEWNDEDLLTFPEIADRIEARYLEDVD